MKITDYLKDVKTEMAHVSFPTRKKTMVFTAIVITLSLGMAIYLGLLDYLLKIGFGQFFS